MIRRINYTLVKDLKNEDPTGYRNLLRIRADTFEELLKMVQDMLSNTTQTEEDTRVERNGNDKTGGKSVVFSAASRVNNFHSRLKYFHRHLFISYRL